MSATPPELIELLTALTDTGLNEAERARLEQLISTDPNLQEFYLDYIELHTMLAWQHGTPVGKDLPPRQELVVAAPAAQVGSRKPIFLDLIVQAVSRPWAVSLIVALATTATFLFALARIYLPGVLPNTQPPEVVAHLERVVNGQWADPKLRHSEGADLKAGQLLELSSGQAAIVFRSGVRVILNGATSFRLEATNRGRLERGELTARVPPRGQGFSVITQHAEVIDLGTEFGVRSDAAGAEVHVFVGKVRVESPVLVEPRDLREGEQIRVVADGGNGVEPGVWPVQFASSAFVRELPPRAPVKSVDGEAYARAVLASQPLAYWRFSELSGTTVRDASGQGHDAEAELGVMFGERGVPDSAYPGVGSENRGIEFFGGRIVAQVPLQDTYSVELWYCNRLPTDNRPISGYLFSRGEETEVSNTGEHLGIGGNAPDLAAPGALFLFNGNHANQMLATGPLPQETAWRHLVLLRDGVNVRLYVNARLAATGGVPYTVEPGTRQIVLGGRSDKMFNLLGGLDEVSIYDRLLSEREVVEHFTAAIERQFLEPTSP